MRRLVDAILTPHVKVSPTTSEEVIKSLNCWALIVDSEELFYKTEFFSVMKDGLAGLS